MKYAHTARRSPQVHKLGYILNNPTKILEEISRNKVSILESVLGKITV